MKRILNWFTLLIKKENDQKIKNYNLISDALNSQPVENKNLVEFKKLLDNEFEKILCNIITGVNHANTIKKMEKILYEMQLIAQCPKLYSKNIGALGGGFSSGKSSFINSFLDNSELILAEGINPVTVIPSYIVCDKKMKIKGISDKGGIFNISTDVYNSLSHRNVKNMFNFDLNRIIHYTMVQTQMNNEFFSNLCLIDTPGFNPSTSGNTKKDFENAQQYIKYAKFLIWLIDIKSGDIPKKDIEFIQKLDSFGTNINYPLYIVINKGKLKTQNEIVKISDKMEETLKDNYINYEGISAYDTKAKKEYLFKKMSIFDFLKEQNKPSEIYKELKKILLEVFKLYILSIRDKKEEDVINHRKVNTIILDAYVNKKFNFDKDVNNKTEESLNELLHYFDTKQKYINNIEMVKDIREKFINCLRKFCDDMGIKNKDFLICLECGEEVIDDNTICEKCKERSSELIKINDKIEENKTIASNDKQEKIEISLANNDIKSKKTNKKTKKTTKKKLKKKPNLAILIIIIAIIIGFLYKLGESQELTPVDTIKNFFFDTEINMISFPCETEKAFVSIIKGVLSEKTYTTFTMIEDEEYNTYSKQAYDAVIKRGGIFAKHKDKAYYLILSDNVNVFIWFKNEKQTIPLVFKLD